MRLRLPLHLLAVAVAVLAAAACVHRPAGENEDIARPKADRTIYVENHSDNVLRVFALNGALSTWIGNVGAMRSRDIPLPDPLPGGSNLLQIRVQSTAGGTFETPKVVLPSQSSLRLDVWSDIQSTTWEVKQRT
ncbi:MAG TPA: hypothetical protein VFQ38_17045 [Longimicrobiales bacterium]|nr:hypothetical protein [Longimicrobiales bacterium]